MVQAWTYNQLLKIRQYRPELVDHIIEELLTRQNELRWLVDYPARTVEGHPAPTRALLLAAR